jgi:hypothetical protein
LAWPQVFVGDEAGEKVLTDCGVSSIPASFLIGPDGRVIARGMRGDAIRDAVKKALATPSGPTMANEAPPRTDEM